MKVYNRDWLINLEKSILWQYDKATSLSSLVTQKQEWYKKNVSKFIIDFFYNVFNLKTANDFGLSIWGKLLNFQRQVVNKNDGTVINLSKEQYRFLLLGQVLKFQMNCTVPEINRYLRIIFNQETNDDVYVIDNEDMTIRYIIEIPISEEIQVLIDNVDFLPKPAGVRISFGQTILYRVDIVNYQNATIVFTINGETTTGTVTETGAYVDVEEGTDVSWVVSKEGYVTQSGTETDVDQNITINADLEYISPYNKNVAFFVNNNAEVIHQNYGSYTIKESAIYKIEIAGGAGYWLDTQEYGYNGGKFAIQLALSKDDVVKIDALVGGWYPVTGEPNVTKRGAGGSGVALYINNELVAVAGGGTAPSLLISPHGYTCCGGGGYLGGNGTVIANVMDGKGMSVDGTKDNVNTSSTLVAPCGGGVNVMGAYGGSGYVNNDYAEYIIENVYGTKNQGNSSYNGYLKVSFVSLA